MKIIRKGKPWSMQFECNDSSCQSLLLVEETDIQIRWAQDPSPTQETHQYFFRCLVCASMTYIDYDIIPALVRERVCNRDKAELEQAEAFKAAGE